MKRSIASGVLGCLMMFAASQTACGQANDKAQVFPKFRSVVETTQGHFLAEEDYRPGDIISSSQVEKLFKELSLLGWNVEDSKEILADVLPDNAFLCRKLRTPKGRAFMREVARYPDAYDRLDRLAKLPYGQRSIERLIKGPGGYKLIQYMTTSAGGQALGVQLSHTPRGAKFNKVTGKIYNEKQLLARLAASYKAELERRQRRETP